MEIVLPYALTAATIISLFFGIIQYILFQKIGRNGLIWGLVGQLVSFLIVFIVLGKIVIQATKSEEATGPTVFGMAFFLLFLILTFGSSFLLNLIIVLFLVARNNL
jgi:hypothetical protein